MVPIKIDCECGQRYAFDVEPVNGRMPSAVACPACGVDGTIAANEFITRQLAPVAAASAPAVVPAITIAPVPPPIAPITPANPVHLSSRVAAPTAAAPKADLRRGLVDRTQAEHEARAKAMWGDSEDQITGYLLLQGFSHPEAVEMVKGLFKERAKAVRANGIRKMLIGFGLVWVPVIAFIGFRSIGVMSLKLMGMAILAGIYGLYLLLTGFLMFVAPKSEKGDVADQ